MNLPPSDINVCSPNDRLAWARACALLLLPSLLLAPCPAEAFCGFYVSKADSKLFNRASQVVLARHGNQTALTMANDYQGDPKEFAVVIPVPTFLEREQIQTVDKAIIDHLDAYTAPRLVEYYDEDPCAPPSFSLRRPLVLSAQSEVSKAKAGAAALGVKIEAEYAVGEYDILLLSAEQSDGLETWLKQNGYRLPEGASRVLDSYIKQNMRFFVAKVNLSEKERLGFAYLRPLQITFQHAKLMLPIRLGTVNADGPQELFIYTLSSRGRIETVNYRTVKLPTGMELPLFLKQQKEFADFYRALFSEQVRRESMRVVFQEYAWDMGWCDPCAADPLSPEELSKLGVSWQGEAAVQPVPPRRPLGGRGGPQNVFVTRLHLRYDAKSFPEDLVFQETPDRANYQGRYVLRHPWTGGGDCPQRRTYDELVAQRQKREASTLAELTGWSLDDIRRRSAAAPAR
jgi:hypothetical protein